MAEAGEFIQIDDKAGTDSRYFCTCSSSQLEGQLHGGVSSRTYLARQLLGDRVLSASADASQGRGFAAAAGDIAIQINDQTGSITASAVSGAWAVVGGRAWIAYREPSGAVRKLYQLIVVDFAAEDGTIILFCKTPSYARSPLLHKSAAIAQLSTDPIDPANPTDPDYLEPMASSVSAGMALGGVDISLKAGSALPVCKLTRWVNTDLRTGDVGGDGEVAFVASAAGTEFTRARYNPSTGLREAGSITFWCRAAVAGGDVDITQVTQLKNAIDSFVAAGYKIILSDGNWFCDILAETPWPGYVDLGDLFFTSSGASRYGITWLYDPMMIIPSRCGLWFCLANADFDDLAPIDDLDPASVNIYAVPASIPVSRYQNVVAGFARNQKTLFSAGDVVEKGGIQMFAPSVSNESSLLSVVAVPGFRLAFELSTLPALDHTGAVENPLADGDVLCYGSGDIESIKTDPTDGWAGGVAPVQFGATSRSGSLSRIWARVKTAPAQIKVDADFFSIENTWRATFQSNPAGGFTRTSSCAAAGPLEISPSEGIRHTFAPGDTFMIDRTATRTPRNPRWSRTFPSLEAMSNNLTPMIQSSGPLPHMLSVNMEVMESFLYAYAKFGFSDIYATVYPFWTRESCHSLAYGDGVIIAGGVGRGTQIDPSGEITWAPIVIPTDPGDTAVVVGTAYGLLGSVPWWVSVGYIARGAVQLPACWLSQDNGVTWVRDEGYQTDKVPTNIRFLDGKFIATRVDGSIDVASEESPFFIRLDWSEIATGATYINDIAFGVGRYLVVGDGGQARYSSDLVTFTDWAYPAGDDLLCVCYSQSSIGGFFHVGYKTAGGSGGGTIFRKYDGSVPTWTAFDLPSGDPVLSITDSAGDIVAVAVNGAIYGRSPAYADDAWKFRLGLGLSSVSDKFGALVFSLSGQNYLVVGGPAQIATSRTLYQGSSAEFEGIGLPDWTPWGTKTARQAMQHLQSQFMGGTLDNWNPIQWQNAGVPLFESFGLAIDPPTGAAQSGTTALDAARKICQESWIFAGDIADLYVDGSADNIEDPGLSDPTAIGLGNIEDCYTQITAQYMPFGGEYLGKAYIQNIETAYVPGNDAFYFAGWDSTGITFGLALWNACRAAYLESGEIRDVVLTFDTVHSASAMGSALGMSSQYLGDRIDWICRRPKYYTITVDGNDSAAAGAHVGSFYKVNPIFLNERGLTLGGALRTGIVVDESHNVTAGKHTLTLAFAP